MTDLFPYPAFLSPVQPGIHPVVPFDQSAVFRQNNHFLNALVSNNMVPAFLFSSLNHEVTDDNLNAETTAQSDSSLLKPPLTGSETENISKAPPVPAEYDINDQKTDEVNPVAEVVDFTPKDEIASADTSFEEVGLIPTTEIKETEAPSLSIPLSRNDTPEILPIVLGYPEKKRKKKKKNKNKKNNMFILDDLSELNSFNKWLLGLKPNEGGHVTTILKKSKKKEKKHKKASMREGIAQSVQKTEKLISESLAIILKNQGHYQESIEMYEQLILNIPEKSAYFAAQIDEIKKLIH